MKPRGNHAVRGFTAFWRWHGVPDGLMWRGVRYSPISKSSGAPSATSRFARATMRTVLISHYAIFALKENSSSKFVRV